MTKDNLLNEYPINILTQLLEDRREFEVSDESIKTNEFAILIGSTLKFLKNTTINDSELVIVDENVTIQNEVMILY